MLCVGQDWYGHQDRNLGKVLFDELVSPNKAASSPDSGSTVDDLLWAAFLADLRDAFVTG